MTSGVAVAARIRSAHDVSLGAYVLRRGAIRAALVAAARRGARVAVTLQADPYDDPRGALARANARSARLLRRAGATARLVPHGLQPFHLKAAICDGVAYLDDRNWPRRGGVVLADDDRSDVALIRAALRMRGGASTALATRKDVALEREAAVIDAARGPVVVSTESFGDGAVAAALLRHAARGAQTVLFVDPREIDERERRVLTRLRAAGTQIEASTADEKFAFAGNTAWIGSANATCGAARDGQLDWGVVTHDPALVAALRRAPSISGELRRSFSPAPAPESRPP